MTTRPRRAFTASITKTKQHYPMGRIIACRKQFSQMVINSGKRKEKNVVVLFVVFSPYTIFIKVHLSAISLPRKQLSIENSACFSFFCLWSVSCAPAVTVCVWSSGSCWAGTGAWPGLGCWLSAQCCGSLQGLPVTCIPPTLPSSERTRTTREGRPGST